jgi:hypothetical protein
MLQQWLKLTEGLQASLRDDGHEHLLMEISTDKVWLFILLTGFNILSLGPRLENL